VSALAFGPRLHRIDEALLEAARRRNENVETLERALHQPSMTLFELFRTEDWPGSHFGRVARSLAVLVDQVFKAADFPEDCPPGFSAKSVQIADIYAPPPTATSRTAFLALWYAQSEPALVPCPELAPVLLGHEHGTLADTRTALHELVWAMTERLNLISPVARALAALADRE
jgi:hypothetical protein